MTKPATLVALAFLLACQSSSPPPEEEAEAAPIRVENAELGLAIAAVPAEFELVSSAGADLELARAGEGVEGRAWVEVEPEAEGGINLVDIVNGQREIFEARPGGSFSGSRELVLPDGRPAYYSRGRFVDGEVEVEEFRVFSVHPLANRLVTVYYRYPAGTDSADRLNDLLLLVGEIEGFDATSPAPAAEGGP